VARNIGRKRETCRNLSDRAHTRKAFGTERVIWTTAGTFWHLNRLPLSTLEPPTQKEHLHRKTAKKGAASGESTSVYLIPDRFDPDWQTSFSCFYSHCISRHLFYHDSP